MTNGSRKITDGLTADAPATPAPKAALYLRVSTGRQAKENARQGYWNGALPPLGYRIVAAEQRGAKIKKKLEIDPIHAETVRLIYRLALKGEGDSGPMGIKSITNHLNARNIRTRDGGKFGIASVHQILTRTTYIGQHRLNTRDHKTRNAKPKAEHAVMEVPPIVTEAEFEAVRAALKARSPQWMPPRAVSGPTLLTGICSCASCGGAMTLRTGKGSQYRYYTCSTKGESGCSGLTVPMDKLDSGRSPRRALARSAASDGDDGSGAGASAGVE